MSKKFNEMVHKLSDALTGGVMNAADLLVKTMKSTKTMPTGVAE
mgnify:CR=1 FL=1|jgi:hypothetical protein